MYYEKQWFRLNSLKANSGRFQFMILGDKTCYKHIFKIDLICVQSSDDVTLLGVMIGKNLTLIWVCVWEGGGGTPPCLFSVNNSETFRAVTLAFRSVQ